MDSFSDWLTENGLERYFPKFEEYGWDDKSLLFEMTDIDIEMCIPKPGHKAKFKKALRREMVNPSVATQTDKDMQCFQKNEQSELAGMIAALVSADLNIAQRTTVAVEQVVNSTDDNKTETVSLESDSDNTSIDTCCIVGELEEPSLGKVGLKSESDETSIEEEALKSDSNHGVVCSNNKELFKEIKTILQQPLNRFPGERKAFAEEQLMERPVDADLYDCTTSDIVICSDRDYENRYETEAYSKTKSAVEMDNTLVAEAQISYGDNLSSVCQKESVSKDVAVVSSESPSLCATGGRQTVYLNDLTIIKHSENTTIVGGSTERIDKQIEPPPNTQDNLYDHMSVLTNSYEQKDELYVETKTYMELKTIVENDHWATLLGKAGDGKSATAVHLLLHYKRIGYQPLFVSSVRQWEALVSSKPGEKQFVVIDDMFGSIYLDDRKVDEWLTEFEKMEKLLAGRKGDILVVCTSRRHIFTDAKSKLYKCSRFRRTSILDMTDKEYKLSGEERSDILRKYADRFSIKIEKAMVDQIKDTDSPHGFPHCVEMFFTNAFLRKSGVSFFINPEEAVQKELYNFMYNDPMKFLVLVLVLYKQNRIHQRHFVEMIERPDEEVENLFKFTGIPLSTAYTGIMKAISALTNTYLTLTTDGYYNFTHESLKENVSKVYINLNPRHASRMLKFEEILTHVNTPTVGETLHNHDLAERITIELLKGNVDSVSCCASWCDQAFVDEWIQFITMPCKASCSLSCLTKTLLEKIFYFDNPSHQYDMLYHYGHVSRRCTLPFDDKRYSLGVFPKTFLSCLLEKRANQAVLAILNNKSIQKSLGRDKKWIANLESLLKVACTTTRDIDVIKAIIAAGGETSDRKKRLNCPYSLIYAIKAVDAECAQYIAENTEISFDEGTMSSYFRSLKTNPSEIHLPECRIVQYFDTDTGARRHRMICYCPSFSGLMH